LFLGVWNLGFLDDADQASIIYPAADVPDGDFGSFNVGSYYNPQVNRLNEQAVRLPGCDLAERIALIQERDRILQDEQLYIWLYVRNQVTAAHDYVQGFDPQPNMPLWNLHTWYIAP
jgi:ABC-type transport system substrate-binding protein